MTGRRIGSGRTRGVVREAALTVGATLGVLCLLSAVAAPLLGLKLLVFQSGSMSPAIDTGAVAITRTVDASQLHKGDVVSVQSATGSRITHRVTGISQQDGQAVLQLKGDANRTADAETYPVTKVDRVVAHVNGLGYVVNALATPYAVFVAGAGAAGLMVLAFRRRHTDDDEEPAEPVVSEGNSGNRKRAVIVAGILVAALGAGTAVWSGARGGSVVPTLAAFSDTAQVNGSAATLTVPNPTGAIECTPGEPNSGTITLAWPDAVGASTAYSYRIDINRQDTGALVQTYNTSATSQLVLKGEVGEYGTYNVHLWVTFDGTTWRSASTITRNIWSNSWILGDINCG